MNLAPAINPEDLGLLYDLGGPWLNVLADFYAHNGNTATQERALELARTIESGE